MNTALQQAERYRILLTYAARLVTALTTKQMIYFPCHLIMFYILYKPTARHAKVKRAPNISGRSEEIVPLSLSLLCLHKQISICIREGYKRAMFNRGCLQWR